MFYLTTRSLLMTRRVVATAALGAVPLLLAIGLALGRVPTFNADLLQILLVPLFVQTVLVFVSVVQATSLIREEIEDQTLPYLITRPVSKPAIAVYKYLGYLVALVVVLIPSIVLAFVVSAAYAGVTIESIAGGLGAFIAVTILGGAAYGAFFVLLSVVTRKPLVAGLLFGFGWEFIVGSIPGDVPKLSIIYYLRSILKEMVPRVFGSYATNLSAAAAAAVLVGFTIGALVLAAIAFQKAEFKEKA